MHVAAAEELSKVKKAYEKDTKLYLAREEEEKKLQRKIQVRQKGAIRVLCTELYSPSPSSRAFYVTSCGSVLTCNLSLILALINGKIIVSLPPFVTFHLNSDIAPQKVMETDLKHECRCRHLL